MWNICRSPCLHSASDKISEISRNITWNQNPYKNDNKNIKQFDDKKIMVVDSQPYNSVVSRVINIEPKPIEPVVGRRKIVPDFNLTHSLDSNDLVFNSRPNTANANSQCERLSSAGNQPKPSDKNMDDNIHSSDPSAPDTEYRQNYSWNKVVSRHSEPPASQTEYQKSFSWPKAPEELPIRDIEPPIVAERVVPGKAVAIETSAKKSATISNFAEVVGKPDILFNKEVQMVPIHEKTHKKKSEYNSKFKPFSQYVYVTGNGFVKPKNLDKTDGVDRGKTWYSEKEERSKMANQYKTRSQLGHPLSSEGLTQIYSEGLLWNNYHIDRDLQALALATTQKICAEKREERNVRALTSPPKSGQTRHLNSAPPSLRTERPVTSSQSSVRTKSPHSMYRPRSADKQPKTCAITESPKPEGKIWLKPKPKTQDSSAEKKVVPNELPKNSVANKPKSNTTNGNGGPKSPRPTSLVNNSTDKKDNGLVKAPIPPLPSGPIRTTQIKSPEEITGVKSPSPESWTVPLDKGLNWMNGETPSNKDIKHTSDMSSIKSTQMIDKSKGMDKKVESEDKNKFSASIGKASHSKPTAKVQPSPSTSLSSIPNPGSKLVQSIDEEVKVVKPANARQKASNVLKHFWTRNK